MSDTKWTPGPWVVGDCAMAVIVEGSGGRVGYPAKSGTIASICDGEYIENTNKYDAHLIAAAPELYDALERLVAHVECGGAANADIEVALDALAKARGES